jgi:hypothetical protein
VPDDFPHDAEGVANRYRLAFLICDVGVATAINRQLTKQFKYPIFMLYFIQEGATMAVARKTVNSETKHDIDYEKDPRFVLYMKMRLEKAKEDREAGRLVDADVVFADIRDRHGW